MKRFNLNTLKSIQWLAGQSIRNHGTTYAGFTLWASKHLAGGKETLREVWEELYTARLVDTLDPNDSYMIRW